MRRTIVIFSGTANSELPEQLTMSLSLSDLNSQNSYMKIVVWMLRGTVKSTWVDQCCVSQFLSPLPSRLPLFAIASHHTILANSCDLLFALLQRQNLHTSKRNVNINWEILQGNLHSMFRYIYFIRKMYES